jgi:hypothetical protein
MATCSASPLGLQDLDRQHAGLELRLDPVRGSVGGQAEAR